MRSHRRLSGAQRDLWVAGLLIERLAAEEQVLVRSSDGGVSSTVMGERRALTPAA